MSLSGLFFCGHLGQEALAAISLASLILNIFGNAVIQGFNSAFDTLFPQIYGGQDKKKIGLILQKGMVISVLTSLMSISLILNSKHVLMVTIKDPAIVHLSDDFMKSSIPSLLMTSLSVQLTKYVQCQDIVWPIMIINLFVFAFNLVLQYVFIYVLDLGINGAAYATDISATLTVLCILVFIRIKNIHIETWPGKVQVYLGLKKIYNNNFEYLTKSN